METLFLAFAIGAALLIHYVYRKGQEHIATEEAVQWALDVVRPLKYDCVDGIYFWYEMTTSRFVAQGRTVEDLSRALQLLNTKKVYMLGDYVFTAPNYQPVLVEGSSDIEVIYK